MLTMKYEIILPFLALCVSIITLFITYFQNRKYRISQIQTAKLEELLECIYELSKFYNTFKELEPIVQRVKTRDYDLNEYFKTYYHEFLQKRMDRIAYLFSRIEVLNKVYAINSTREKITEYHNIMYSFYKYVLSLEYRRKDEFKNGFPSEGEIRDRITYIESNLLTSIKKYK